MLTVLGGRDREDGPEQVHGLGEPALVELPLDLVDGGGDIRPPGRSGGAGQRYGDGRGGHRAVRAVRAGGAG
ncbi:hypothetical protein HUT19_24560 [Streptomyces sp. NA02950]|nr:hypothetical protein HUT19_24560 [Streptomyces sp. NA02950]